MGSQSIIRCAVGRLNRSVQIADERMGFVQAMGKGCLQPGGVGLTICASMRPGDPRPVTRPDRDPFPPTPYAIVRGSTPNFRQFFNLYDNQPTGAFVNGY